MFIFNIIVTFIFQNIKRFFCKKNYILLLWHFYFSFTIWMKMENNEISSKKIKLQFIKNVIRILSLFFLCGSRRRSENSTQSKCFVFGLSALEFLFIFCEKKSKIFSSQLSYTKTIKTLKK